MKDLQYIQAHINDLVGMAIRAQSRAHQDFINGNVATDEDGAPKLWERSYWHAENDTSGKEFPEAYGQAYVGHYQTLQRMYDKGYAAGVASMRSAILELEGIKV